MFRPISKPQRVLFERNRQRQQTRAMLRSNRRAFVRSNENMVIRAKQSFAAWVSKMGGLPLLKKTAKPIPLDLRPWLPRNRGRWTVEEYCAALKAAKVRKHQWTALIAAGVFRYEPAGT